MTYLDVIKAWKNEEFRSSLSAEQRALLPAHPSGAIELDDLALGSVAGGTDMITSITITFCPSYTACLCPTITFCPTVNVCDPAPLQ